MAAREWGVRPSQERFAFKSLKELKAMLLSHRFAPEHGIAFAEEGSARIAAQGIVWGLVRLLTAQAHPQKSTEERKK